MSKDDKPKKVTGDVLISAINSWLEYGEQQYGKSQQGYFSGDGFAATTLRGYRDSVEAEIKSERELHEALGLEYAGEMPTSFMSMLIKSHKRVRAERDHLRERQSKLVAAIQHLAVCRRCADVGTGVCDAGRKIEKLLLEIANEQI